MKIFLLIIFNLLLFSFTAVAQSEAKIEKFLEANMNFILVSAHENSTYIYSEITIEDETDDGIIKTMLELYYKGYVKRHRLICYVYFNETPINFIWGIDSNPFAIKTSRELMVEDLKYRWKNFKFDE